MPSNLPIIKPLNALLHSRKFMVALVTMLFNLLIVSVPTLGGDVKSQLIAPALLLGMTLVLGISHEDANKTTAGILNPTASLQEQLKNLLTIAVDEVVSSGSATATSQTTVKVENNPGYTDSGVADLLPKKPGA